MIADPLIESARRVHDDAIVVDAVCPPGYWRAHRDDWIAGGATACGLTVGVFHFGGGFRGAYDFLYELADVYRFVRETPGLRLATSVADVRAAKAEGELAVILCFQGTEAIEYEPSLLEVYWRLGVRVVQLAYNRRNPLCDGCAEPSDAGLSVLGRRVIAEMNRLGMLVDVSHTGVRSSMEAIEASSAPCIASHSNAAAVHANKRNLPDELIKAIAASGGVIGMNGYPSFVAATDRPTLDQFIDHIVYIDSLVGPGHVGLGIDYTEDPPGWSRADFEAWNASQPEISGPDIFGPPPYHYPAGLERPKGLPALTARLLERGYDEGTVRGVLGANWLRVYGEVWT
jgi:membrane dipeptidase